MEDAEVTSISDGAHTDDDVTWSFLTPERPPLSMFHKVDEMLQDNATVLYTDDAQGYYVALDGACTMEILRDPARFSSHAVMAIDPEPAYGLTPIMTDPPIHTKWRQLLGAHFSPATVKQFAPRIRAHAVQLVSSLAPRGECDFMTDFASQL